jgi:L-alanine-DL-glutamate epimerase-like enolase superfamily enzyme
MRIRAISIFTVDLPLAQPFRHASSGLIDRLEQVVIKIETQEGHAGWAEVRGNAAYVTGDDRGRVLASLTGLLCPALLARPEISPATLGRLMDGIVAGNGPAKAALEIAAHDALARTLGAPLRHVLGAGNRASLAIHASLPFCPPEEAARTAIGYLDRGIRKIKLRVGLPRLDDDLARLDAVRDAIAGHEAADEVRIATGTNQGWSVKRAIDALRRFEAYDLAWAEQPVGAADLAGLSEVRQSTAIAVLADESCGTMTDLLRIIALRAADGVHLKLVKAGGVRALMAMVEVAEASGLPYVIGQMDEGTLATAAGLACAAAASPLSCELWGYQRVGAQPFSDLAMENGHVQLPAGPGLGITVDEAALTPVQRFEDAA